MPNTPVDYDSPAALKTLLESEGLAMSKRFGQNFLVNRNARERILKAALGLALPAESGAKQLPLDELPRADGLKVWEIGPGIGSMTELALEAGAELTVFEIDHGFVRLLHRLFDGRPNFRLVEGDFLKTWRGELAAGGAPDLVFGNLPYNVANAIVADILENSGGLGIAQPPMAFTVQKEAALRMGAKPGTKDYSAYSVLCTSTCKVTLAFDLAAGSFWPVPGVTSSLALLKPRAEPIGAQDRKSFSAFSRAAFSSRRKTIKNNLKSAGWSDDVIEAACERLGMSSTVRAEALEPAALERFWLALGPRGASTAGMSRRDRGQGEGEPKDGLATGAPPTL